jgi:hypothetical protein
MIKNKLLTIILFLFLFGCKEKKEIKIKKLFSTYLSDNGGNGDFNSKIGISNSTFHTEVIGMAHIGGYIPVDTTNFLWINGKEIKTNLTFNDIKKKYKTKNVDLNKITKNNTLNNLKFNKFKTINLQQAKTGYTENYAIINDKFFAQLIDKASTKIFLKIIGNNYNKEFKLQSFSETNGAIINSYDITKDGSKEIFILSQSSSYWGSNWKVDVYQVENLN